MSVFFPFKRSDSLIFIEMIFYVTFAQAFGANQKPHRTWVCMRLYVCMLVHCWREINETMNGETNHCFFRSLLALVYTGNSHLRGKREVDV